MKKVCVIGCLNVDMIVGADTFPRLGETVFVDDFQLLIGGGKGANQAVALGRLGGDVRMVGLLGDQFYGADYWAVLAENGVVNDSVEVRAGVYPGIAYVAVGQDGNNMIFTFSGANQLVTPEYIDKHWDAIAACDIFLFQQGIPRATNLYAMKRLTALGGKTIVLDPAPARDFVPELLQYADIITPNETEMLAISGIEVTTLESYRRACDKMHSMGAKTVLSKAGGGGVYISRDGSFTHVPAFSVKVVDTTAAGDSFNAGLAYGLSIGLDLISSVIVAHAVAGIATTKMGAQSAMPDLPTVLRFLQENAPEQTALLAALQQALS